LLTSLARRTPVVIFIEDAHWLDNDSKALVKDLAERIGQAAILILLAERAAASEGKRLSDKILGGPSGAASRTLPTLTLNPLTPGGTTELVAHLLVSELAQVIHEQSNGNPLLIEEITHWFQRAHNISAGELRSALQTSGFIQKLILSSVESLPEAQREIVRAASIIGPEFRGSDVQALLPTFDPVTLSQHLRALTQAHILYLSEAGADARYAYQQMLVRDILYNSLPFEQRRTYHAQLAAYLSQPLSSRRSVHSRITAALETSPTINPIQQAETIADHYERAALWPQAAQTLLGAGGLARQQREAARAASLYARALEALNNPEPAAPPLPGAANENAAPLDLQALKLQLYLAQGDTAVQLADYLTATTAYEAARLNLPTPPPAAAALNLASKLALVLPLQRRAEEAEAQLRKAIETHQAQDHLNVAAIMAWLLTRLGKSEAPAWIERCQALAATAESQLASLVKVLAAELAGKWGAARIGYVALDLPTGAALASIHMGDQSLAAGHLHTAMDHYKQADELWRNTPEPATGLSLALFCQAAVFWQRQDVPAARQSLAAALEALEHSPAVLQAEGHSAIQQAQRLVNKGQDKPWPVWQWQPYADVFHLTILFPAD
jgi:hypothetical protein